MEAATESLEQTFRRIRHDISCAAHRLDVMFDQASAEVRVGRGITAMRVTTDAPDAMMHD